MQVRFMRKIYENASRVIAWVGEPSMNNTAAIELLDWPLSPGSSVQKTSVEERKAIAAFFNIPYWRRAWIIQEAAVGSSVTILCGSRTIN
jgi:hypothetical protein